MFLAPHLEAANVGAVERKGELFAHLEFCKSNRGVPKRPVGVAH